MLDAEPAGRRHALVGSHPREIGGEFVPSRWASAVIPILFVWTTEAADIHSLVAANRVAAVQTVLEEQPALIHATTPEGATPLHIAAALGYESLAVVLLALGADPHARTSGGFTPLHWASGRDAWRTARLLLWMGADPNAPAANGMTPLHWAAGENATNVVPLLLAAGARTDVRTVEGYTPLEYALFRRARIAAERLASYLSEQEDAAAYTTATSPPERESPSPPSAVSKRPPRGLPAVEPGRALKVDMGHGQELEFVWVESLQLWFGKYEITNGQYRRFRRNHSSLFRERFSLDGDRQPVVFVSWEDTQKYIRWLNAGFSDSLPHGYAFRLPTEAEWVTVARCGDQRVYPWGNEWPPRYGNFSDLTAKNSFAMWHGIDCYDDGHVVTCPVEESGANEAGICGLAGNVWEWCEDWYDARHTYRVRRGGSWDFDSEPLLRIETRGFDRPDARVDTVGFRLVVAPRRR